MTALTIKHPHQTAIDDDPGADVGGDEWNADHALAGPTSGALLFFNGSALDEMAGSSWDDTNRSLTLSGATVTASHPVLDLSQTWNNAAVAFSGLKFDVTNTASAAGSLLLDLQVDADSKFNVEVNGMARANGASDPVTGTPGTNWGLVVNQAIDIQGNFAGFQLCDRGNAGVRWQHYATGSVFRIYSSDFAGDLFLIDPTAGVAGFGLGTGGLGATLDTRFCRDAAGIFAQRNSTNAQTFRVYNIYSDTDDYERAVIDWTTTANTLTIGVQAAGSGTRRNLTLVGNRIGIDSDPSVSCFLAQAGGWLQFDGQNGVYVSLANTPKVAFAGSTMNLDLGWGLSFSSATNPVNNAGDTGISRSAAGVLAFGNGTVGNASATIKAKTKAGAPDASDVPDGTWVLIRDTSGATTKLYYNNGGTLQSATLS